MTANFSKSFDRSLSIAERRYVPIASRSARPVIVFGKWYPSLSEAARQTKNSKQNIWQWIRNGSTRAQYA